MLDTLTPHDGVQHAYESPFHLDAEEVEVSRRSVSTRNPCDSNLKIIPAIVPGLKLEIVFGQTEPYVQGWVKEGEYGVRPIPTPTYRLKKKGMALLAYVFYPTPKDERCPVDSLSIKKAGDNGVPTEIEVLFQNGKKHTWRTDTKERALVVSD